MAIVIARLCKLKVVKRDGGVSNDITITEHIYSRKDQKERTALVHGGLTFNDLKAGNQDKKITEFDCLSRTIPYSK